MNIPLFIRSVFRSYLFDSDIEQKTQDTTVTIENEPSLHTSIGVNNTLQDVDGVGSSYEEKLKNVNINTVEELAKESPEELSKKVSISENYANRWITSARNILK